MKYIVTMSGNVKYIFDVEAHNEEGAKEKAYEKLHNQDGDIEIIDVDVF